MKTYLKWSLRAFALSWSVVFKLLFIFSAVMPRLSVLFCLIWVCRQTFSNNVVNVTVIGFGHFFGGYYS